MYIDNIMLFAKNEKELETGSNNKNIEPEYRNGIWLRKMCHAQNEKWKKTNNRSAKSRKNQNTWNKEKL